MNLNTTWLRIALVMGALMMLQGLPITAQVIFQDQPFVLEVVNGKVDRVALRKGLSDKDYFEVLNAEITPQSQIIIQGKGLVRPGEIVQPVSKSE